MILKKPRARCAAPYPGLLLCIIESVGAATGRPWLPLLIKGSCPSAHTGAEGIRTEYFDNPSVMALRETAMTAPFTQGSRGAPAPVRHNNCLLRHALFVAAQKTERYRAGTQRSTDFRPAVHALPAGAPDHTLSAMPRRRYRAGTQWPTDYCPAVHALSAATRRRLSDESPGRTEPECPGRNESRSPPPHS